MLVLFRFEGEKLTMVRLQPLEPYRCKLLRLRIMQALFTIHMHSRRCEQRVDKPIQINQSVHMCMQQSTLWHFLHNLPQLRLLHCALRQIEHHTGMYSGIELVRNRVLDFGIPY